MSTPPTRGPSRLHSLLAAMRNAGAGGGVELVWFFDKLLTMACNPDDPRAKPALTIIGDSLPKYKPASEPVAGLEGLSSDPVEAHGQIMAAIGRGELGADAAAVLVGLLEAGQRIATAGQITDEIKAMREELEIVKSELAARNVGAEGAPQILPAATIPDASPADIPPPEAG